MALEGALESGVVMITGQHDCEPWYFDKYYAPAIEHAIEHGCSFVLSANEGVDVMARDLLWKKDVKDVTIYYRGTLSTVKPGWNFVNGFASTRESELAMIEVASHIIVYLFENAIRSDTWYYLMSFANKTIRAQAWSALGHCVAPIPLWPDEAMKILTLGIAYTRGAPYCATTWEIEDDNWKKLSVQSLNVIQVMKPSV